MRSFYSLPFSFLWAALVAAQYAIYQPKDQVIYGGTNLHLTATPTTAPSSNFTTLAAYDQTVLTPPAIPNPAIPTSVPVQLQSSGVTSNISVPINGAFFGISIEMSVANQVCESQYFSFPSTLTNSHLSGQEQVCSFSLLAIPAIVVSTYTSSLLQVAFLNLMSNLVERAGWVQVRVGGNSQESAGLVSSLPNGTMLAKDTSDSSGPTSTPPLVYTLDLLYTLGNISQLTNTHWYLGWLLCATFVLLHSKLIYLGIPFVDAQNISLAIVEQGQKILGDKLLGFQAGNEPDLYAAHDHRPSVRSSVLGSSSDQ